MNGPKLFVGRSDRLIARLRSFLYAWRFIDQADGQLFVLWPKLAERYAEEDIEYSPFLIFDLVNFYARGGSDRLQFIESGLEQPEKSIALDAPEYRNAATAGFDRAQFGGADQVFFYRGTAPFRFSDEPGNSAYLLSGVRRLFSSLPIHPAIKRAQAACYERAQLTPKMFDAVHVRRGDVFDMLATELPPGLGRGLTSARLDMLIGHFVKRTAPLEFYFPPIERAISAGKKILMTSDTPDTVQFFQKKYGRENLIDLGAFRMRIPIQKAFLDFLVLCDAAQITGTASNFSMTPAELGQVPLENVATTGDYGIAESLFRRKFLKVGLVDDETASEALRRMKASFEEYRDHRNALARGREARAARKDAIEQID